MFKKITFLTTIFALFICVNVNAQSFFDRLKSSSVVNSVVNNVTGGIPVTSSRLVGTWNYSNVAVSLESEDLLKSTAGTAATSQIEKKLNEVFSKVGISANLFSFTFNSDNSFACNYKGKAIKGTYTLDTENNKITLNYSALNAMKLGSMTANVAISTNGELSLLFKADKLLSFVSKIAALTKNSTITSLSTLVNNYDGVMLGFELKK